ncbi:hypothetical protein ACI78T_03715 [Blastococcus sp. SYSU D00922]
MAGKSGEVLTLQVAYDLVGMTARDVWFRYLALGGTADEVSVSAQLHGVLDLRPGEFNILAHALNEELDDLPGPRPLGRVAYLELTVREEPGRR